MHYTHDQHTAKALAIAVVIFFASTMLTGCAKPSTIKQERQPTLTDAIGNMSNAGKAVACVFAPWHDECKRLREDRVPHQTQEEYIEEINKDFDQLDKDAQSDNQ
mgnify:CR=1 FL=1|jgi:hypothetical protein